MDGKVFSIQKCWLFHVYTASVGDAIVCDLLLVSTVLKALSVVVVGR